MSTPTDKPGSDREDQREALEQSEKKANEKQPRNWKEDAVTDKQVEIKPETGPAPIQGLDP